MEEKIDVATDDSFRHRTRVVAFISLGLLLCSMNIGFFCFCMPSIAAAMHTTWANVAWSLVCYFAVVTSFLNLFRQISARCGAAFISRLGFILFAVGSLLCAFSASWGELLIFRLIQAIGAACLQAVVFVLFVENVPLKAYPSAVKKSGFMLCFGLFLGVLLGGLVMGLLSWRWAFGVLVALALVGMFLTWGVEHVKKTELRRLDIVGSVLFLILLSTFFAGLGFAARSHTELTVAHAFFLICILVLIVFFLYESHRESPFMKLSLYRSFGFSVAMLAKITHAFATTVILITPAVYLFYIKNLGIYHAMAVVAVPALGITIGSIINGVVSNEHKGGAYAMLAILFFVLPIGYITLIDAGSINVLSMVALFVFGIGSGLLQQILLKTTFEILDEPPPVIGSTFRTMHNLGCALAAAVSVYFVSKYWVNEPEQLVTGIGYVLVFSFALLIVTLVFAGMQTLFYYIGRSKRPD